MRSPPRARDVEELDELAIQQQANQNSEAHSGEVGLARGGEPGQGVRGSVKTPGALGAPQTRQIQADNQRTRPSTRRSAWRLGRKLG